jgi:phage FluMu protein Com
MEEKETRCPHCQKLLMKNNSIKCSRCKSIVGINCGHHNFDGSLEKKYHTDIDEVKKIIAKWPIPLQEDFLRTFEVFQDYNLQ